MDKGEGVAFTFSANKDIKGFEKFLRFGERISFSFRLGR